MTYPRRATITVRFKAPTDDSFAIPKPIKLKAVNDGKPLWRVEETNHRGDFPDATAIGVCEQFGTQETGRAIAFSDIGELESADVEDWFVFYDEGASQFFTGGFQIASLTITYQQ